MIRTALMAALAVSVLAAQPTVASAATQIEYQLSTGELVIDARTGEVRPSLPGEGAVSPSVLKTMKEGGCIPDRLGDKRNDKKRLAAMSGQTGVTCAR